MRKTILASVFLFLCTVSNAQVYKYIEKIPLFSLSAGTSYLVDSKDFGGFLKYYFPTNNGLAFYAQGVALFPTSEKFKEYRLEAGIELVFFKYRGFSTHALMGINYGYWQRENEFSLYFKKDVPKSEGGNHFHKDNSHFFGGGIDFEFNKYCSIYASWKGYPDIFVSYAEAGVRFNIYSREDKTKVRRRKPRQSLIR
ncbi:MAG: hypothetical protein ACKOXB_10085 [Flavobacteriales bacterium]